MDDFKLVGKKDNIGPMWTELRKNLDLDPPVKLQENVYLGMGQREVEPPMEQIKIRSEFYQETFERSARLRTKATLDDELKEKGGTPAPSNNSKRPKRKLKIANKPCKREDIRAWEYDMRGHVQQSIDKYLELAKKTKDSLKYVATPCLEDSQIPPEDFDVKGALSTTCSFSFS